MKRFAKLRFIIGLICFVWQGAQGHYLWINSSKSHVEPHILVTLGFGHDVPQDDFLTTDAGTIQLKTYSLYGPDGSKTSLKVPDPTPQPYIKTSTKLMAGTGDLGAYKFKFSKDSMEGTYQVTATSIPAFLVEYKDSNGRTRFARAPVDEIDDQNGVASVERALRYTYYSKAFFTINRWTSPEPIGHLLELVPDMDISNVHTGDIVRFRLLLNGRPVIDPTGNKFVTAISPSFSVGSGPNSYSLASTISDGNVQFRIPSAGLWLVKVNLEQKVDETPELINLQGKVIIDGYYASLTFTVLP